MFQDVSHRLSMSQWGWPTRRGTFFIRDQFVRVSVQRQHQVRHTVCFKDFRSRRSRRSRDLVSFTYLSISFQLHFTSAAPSLQCPDMPKAASFGCRVLSDAQPGVGTAKMWGPNGPSRQSAGSQYLGTKLKAWILLKPPLISQGLKPYSILAIW